MTYFVTWPSWDWMENDNIARLLKRKDKCWTVEVNLSALEEGEDRRETGEIKLFSFVAPLQFVVKHALH